MTLEATRTLLVTLALGALFAAVSAASGDPPGSAPPPAPSAAATPAVAPAASHFSWGWSEGDVVRYRFENDTEMTISNSLSDQPMTTAIQQVLGYLQEVLGVSPEGVAEVRTTYDLVELSAEVPGLGTSTWSSADPEAEVDPRLAGLGGPWAYLVDRPIVLEIDRRGELLAVEGLEEILRGLVAELTDAAEAGGVGSLMRPMLEKLFDENSFLELSRQGGLVFPDEPLAPGDSWTRELSVEVPMLGELTQSQTYTFERLDGDRAIFSLAGRLEMGSDGPDLEELAGLLESMEVDIATRRGEVEGTTTFDRKRGLLVHHEGTVRLDIALTMTPTGELVEMFPEPLVVEMATTTRAVQALVEP